MLCSKPIFHRPFLDGPVSTPAMSVDTIGKSSESFEMPLISGNTEPHRVASQETRDVAIDAGVLAEGQSLTVLLQTVSQDSGDVGIDRDIQANDGRLSAALGLICLSSVTEPSRSSTESSLLQTDSISGMFLLTVSFLAVEML